MQEGKPEMKPHKCSVVSDLPGPGDSWNLSLQAPASLLPHSAFTCVTHWCPAQDFVRSKALCLMHPLGFQKRVVRPREVVPLTQGHPAGMSSTRTWVSQAMPTSFCPRTGTLTPSQDGLRPQWAAGRFTSSSKTARARAITHRLSQRTFWASGSTASGAPGTESGGRRPISPAAHEPRQGTAEESPDPRAHRRTRNQNETLPGPVQVNRVVVTNVGVLSEAPGRSAGESVSQVLPQGSLLADPSGVQRSVCFPGSLSGSNSANAQPRFEEKPGTRKSTLESDAGSGQLFPSRRRLRASVSHSVKCRERSCLTGWL